MPNPKGKGWKPQGGGAAHGLHGSVTRRDHASQEPHLITDGVCKRLVHGHLRGPLEPPVAVGPLVAWFEATAHHPLGDAVGPALGDERGIELIITH